MVRPDLSLGLLLLLASTACSSGDIVVGKREGGGVSATNRASSIPIGIENVNNSAMSAANYRALLRFVPDATISIDRLYFGFKLRGASCREPGAAGDGAGDGGVLEGSLVQIDPATGLPADVIAMETVNACERHDEAALGVGATPVLGWVSVPAALEAGVMYGLIVRNAHAEPLDNFFSFHMPIADTELSGPQARNELDPRAAGAIMSLDPREHVAWSIDDGESWSYGSDNGEYRSYMNDDDTAHPATRIPHYGFRLADGTIVAPQPYYAYKTDCASCTVAYRSARYARTFSELGGFTAGTDVGVLTITNTSTGEQSSCTPGPGYGFRTCALPVPVSVAEGDEHSIGSTGSVELMRMDNQQRLLFPTVGTAAGEHRGYQPDPAPGTDEKDVPSLWAGPLSPNFPTLAEK